MRKPLTLAVVTCLLVSFGNLASAQTGIPWLTDWRQARDIAQKQHRLVLLHFWSETCAPCKRLEARVFNRPEVARAMQSAYIPVKVNVDQEPKLANHYGVNSWPTDVIVDFEGRVIHRTQSPPEAHQYVAFLDSIKARHAVAIVTPQTAPTSTPRTPRTANSNAAAPSPLESTQHRSAPQRNSSYAPPSGRTQPGNQVAGNSASPASNPQANPLANSIASKPATPGRPYANPFLAAPANNQTQPGANASSSQDAASNPNAGPSAYGLGVHASPAPTGFAPPAAPQGNMPQNTIMPNQYAAPGGNAWNGQARQAMVSTQPRQQRPPLPEKTDVFGLESYCPVTLIEGNVWSRGDPRWGAIHRGRTYLFSNSQNQQRFLANPNGYAPILSGYDPVHYIDAGLVIEGKRRHGLYYGSKYFLFSDEASLQKFQSNPNRYMPADVMR